MNNNTLKRLSVVMIAIVIINLIASAIFIVTLPERVPVHFNASLICDRIGSRWTGMIAPAIMAIVFPLCLLGESKGGNSDKNRKPLTIIVSLIAVMCVGVSWFILLIMHSGAELGERIPANFDVLVQMMLGLMFAVTGNYMPTVRQNKTLGIKLPWTLKNERCWDKTHRFGGRIMVIVGILMRAAAFVFLICEIRSTVPFVLLTLTAPTIAIVLQTIYAYCHRND